MDEAKNTWVVILLAITLYTDVKGGKIYNIATFPSMVFGILVNGCCCGFDGIKWSVFGWGVSFGIFFFPYILGGLKAGDVKLLCAVGAIKGPTFAFYACMATAVCGGIIAALLLLKRRALMREAKNMGGKVFHFVLYKIPLRLDDAKSAKFPYGVAITLGTLLVLLAETLCFLPLRL